MLFLKKKIEVFRRKLIGKVEQNERALRKSRMERGVTLPLIHLPQFYAKTLFVSFDLSIRLFVHNLCIITSVIPSKS